MVQKFDTFWTNVKSSVLTPNRLYGRNGGISSYGGFNDKKNEKNFFKLLIKFYFLFAIIRLI